MKNIKTLKTTIIVTLANLLIITSFFAQSPEKMSYQAVVRDASNNLVTNTEVGMQISILQSTASGTAVYVETQITTTNENGLVTIEIGTGIVVTGDFSTIDWGADTYFIKTEIDLNGGTDYTITGTNQLLSVPYALYAKASKLSEGIAVYTAAEIAALTPKQGYAVYNVTEDLYQIFNGNTWVSLPTSCWPQPTDANAGGDQTFNDGTTTAILSANTPEVEHGTGTWTIISGTGGSFVDVNSPITTFTGVLRTAYTLQWTISTNCSSSIDEVQVTFAQDAAGSILTDYDGNTYNTVWIGGQLWMAENLKVINEPDGTSIPNITDNVEWGNLEDNNTDKAYCYYLNSTENASEYGALYTFAAAKIVCPTGWHLPTDEEWTELTNYISNSGHFRTEGTALKSLNGWFNDGNGTDDYGFSAMPGGSRYDSNGQFRDINNIGIWWSGTESLDLEGYAISRKVVSFTTYVDGNAPKKSYGLSVRCVKD